MMFAGSDLRGDWQAERAYGAALRATTAILARRDLRARMPFAGGELRIRVAKAPSATWIQPGNPENAERFATPVTVTAAGSNAWRFAIHPLRDVQHVDLIIQQMQNGETSAFFRNPEENAGARLGVRSVIMSGSTIRLQRSGSEDIMGTVSPDGSAITLTLPGLPGPFTFARSQPVATPYRYRRPATGKDGWNTGTLREVGLDETAVTHIVDDIRTTAPDVNAPYIQGLLIARHGKLVLDEYFNGFDSERPHDVRSAGKSVATLIAGRAIEDTHRFSPATRVASILSRYAPFANDDERKQQIAVGNLMSMSAGYACDDNDDASPGSEDRMQSQTAQPDWYKFTLDLPMLFAPGTRALYCSAEINLLGAVIMQETGEWLPAYFDARFARPMRFGSYGMWLMPPPNETAYMAGGDHFRPRDFLKFGQLLLDGGRWHGKPIVDGSWLADSTKKHSYVEGGGGDYGYGWHLATYTLHGETIDGINAGGNGGQLLYVFPKLDMTVMITAANYGQFRVWSRFETDLIPKILAAVAP